MNRYFYETPERSSQGKAGMYRVFDRNRGAPESYAAAYERAVALCDSRDDAELVTAALNAGARR